MDLQGIALGDSSNRIWGMFWKCAHAILGKCSGVMPMQLVGSALKT